MSNMLGIVMPAWTPFLETQVENGIRIRKEESWQRLSFTVEGELTVNYYVQHARHCHACMHTLFRD